LNFRKFRRIAENSSGYAAAMPHYSDSQLTAYQRDKMIVDLRKRGYTYRAIGKAVGLDASAVLRAWRRLEAGGPGTRPPRS
jgi:hypothetical protein